MINALRGEFSAIVGGERHAFDTTLGSIARIEEANGGRSIMEIINAVVMGRRAADHMPLITAALRTAGVAEGDAGALAARATLAEAEAFVLALMGALGFKLARGEAGDADQSPFPASNDGAAGAPSPSASSIGAKRPSGAAPGPASSTPGMGTAALSGERTRTSDR